MDRRKKKLTDLCPVKDYVETPEFITNREHEIGERVVPREQIESFICNIRREVDDRGSVAGGNGRVVVEDSGPEGSLAGVNSLPGNCPLLLVNLGEVSSDIDSVLRNPQEELRHAGSGLLHREVVTVGESTQGSAIHGAGFDTEHELRENGMPADNPRNYLGNGAVFEGNRTVVNLSKRVLTEAEISLLSKGLKFCPTPEKIDVYHLRKDIKEYIRRIRLKEYFYSDEAVDGDFSEMPAFRKKSGWTPERNREIALEAYVEALENRILRNDFETPCQRNLTRDEQRALENLRNYADIVIKQADKGSAVVVMDKEVYIREAMRQLGDQEVYTSLDEDPTRNMVEEINDRIRECYEKGHIDKGTRDYLLANEKSKPGRFYLLPKIHKPGCPGRPVVSGCNTPTERISEFVDHVLRPLIPEMGSYIKDTNDFLRKLGGLGRLPEGAILCTIDVVGLYPHIPHNEGLEAVKEALMAFEGSQGQHWEGSFNEDIVAFTELVLKNNNFEFNDQHYLQKLGTAIGTRMAPSYANIFMDNLERRLIRNAEFKPHTWWRFIDDIFIIWTHGEEKLKEFLDYLNNAHRTIKFTSKWSMEEIEFLDVKVVNESGVLETDLHVKPTDSHQYLYHTSCHPKACKKGIPYAQALRLRRVCSKSCFFEKRAKDLIEFLVERGYKRGFVESQIGRARRLPREETLRDKQRDRNERVPLVVTYHPGLPNIGQILRELHPILESSDRCSGAINSVPMVSFRRPKSLADYLVRARVNSSCQGSLPKGTYKCNSRRCEVCNYLDEKNSFVSTKTQREYSINYNLNCNSVNVIYLITCKVCGLQYVGSTTNKFRLRFNNHKTRVNRHERLNEAERKKDDLLYKHFWSEGHRGLRDVNVQLIDRVNGEEELRDKEGQWAYRLKSVKPSGLNDNDFFFDQNKRTRRAR